MKSLSVMILGLLLCLLLSSCTPVPIIIPRFPEEEAFQDKELQFLKPGETTLSEIKDHLWEPMATRKNGRLLLYKGHNTRLAAWVGTGLAELRDDAFLFIEMNENNKLKRYEVLRKHQGFFLDEVNDCTSWGLCLDMEILEFQSLESRIDDATYIIYSPKIGQSELEDPLERQCQIITYLVSKDKIGTLRVHIDENPDRLISRKGFLENIVVPGNHKITVNWSLDSEKTFGKWEGPLEQEIYCNSGESLYVSVSGKASTILPLLLSKPKLNMKIETAEEGLKVIRERRLILD